MQQPFYIKRIAVLGAGVMGAQIAAHCVNAGIETLLYDLADENNHYAVVDKALKHLSQLKPSPLGTKYTASLIQAKNYQDDMEDLSQCDLIIEAIAEKIEWKADLYQRISPYLNERAVLVTNTSGLSINTLANALPEVLRDRFCGVHFFNPPRYMHLAELIPAESTSDKLLNQLESWLTSYLGKGVVRAKDTPNFIANRIGVFSLISTIYNAQKMQIGFDDVDALTGPLIGRPKSATFRTMDVVGLDTMAHVVHTMHQQLKDDPWHEYFTLPEWLMRLINEGKLGQKSGEGIYRKNGKTIEVYDVGQADYRPAKGNVSEEIEKIFKEKDPGVRFKRLFHSSDPQAQFLSACFRDLFHYSAYHLEDIADTVRDVDLAMRWGFGWQQGPFEIWQLAGVAELKEMIKVAIEDAQTMSDVDLPDWLNDRNDFYTEKGAYSPAKSSYEGRSDLAVYQRQFFPDRVLAEKMYPTEVVYENEGVKLWHLKDEVAILSFKTKANTIGRAVLDGFNHALDVTEKQFQGLIICQSDENNFSSGADLRGVASLVQSGDMDALKQMITDFQALAMRIKYSPIPVIAALRGRALGGGCELMMHCARVVAGYEVYPGLVEAGVGLIPAGGGCKEMALKAAEEARHGELMNYIKPYFEQIAMAIVSSSAADAKERHYLRAKDSWVMHHNEVLYAALEKIKQLQAENYVPPIPSRFQVAGRVGHAMLQVGLVNWKEGGFISDHDYFLANQLASVLCGGDVNAGELVDEQWILKLEREAFMTLAATKETQARINHLLETGKPLRN
ncbi:3-hydroxyacyl-CoA dehydrogenase/enoyl-CoA hydratase family protein [Legionella impletisoli]|uniref:3-hydroxyacyl-CoA dehydrogenase n=1 Tax=Legionella impletisoli TaxID=343510 RepID=A0A917N849_9GAMM|nr:3-hydroxyacyl-CoA dehydrogenase/enoyl-CoA hydratase family protein [Legionella impletisoli]GGI76792.1 3-hydroxyacyl-CoA dehydrogenase [Legionella impletisoli]